MSFALDEAVRLTSALLGVAIILSSAELLVESDRLKNNDLLGWAVGRYHSKITMTGWVGRMADFLFEARQFRILLVLRLITAVVIVVGAMLGKVSPWLLAIAFVGTFVIALRSVFGLDGAFQMNLVTLAGLWFHAASPLGSIAACAGLWFITAQLGASYAVAGLRKIPTKGWRNGSALIGVLGTSVYGHRAVFRIMNRHRILAVLASWTVMTFEISFVPMALSGGRMASLIMAIGIVFHLSNAMFMGLNGFLISFVAAYPIAWSLMTGGA
jgi:hypothetical protein